MAGHRDQQDYDEVGRGPLSRGSAVVYRFLVLEVLLVITTLPTAVAVVLLARDASNIPLYALAAAPIAPAVVAGVSAVTAWSRTPDLSPARPFWRAYRDEALPTLAWWLPCLAVVALLGINLANLGAVPGGPALRPALIVLLLVVAVWAGHMVVLQSGFSFRLRDAMRIAVVEIVPQWRFSVGVLSLHLVLAAVTVVSFDVVAVLLAWAAVALLQVMSRPLVIHITQRFTRDS